MSTYHEFLRQRFVEKQQKNKSFSMRAFAALIGLTPGGASRLLRGQMGLSLERAQEIAHKLQLSEKDTEFFLGLLQLSHAKSPELKARVLNRLQKSGSGKVFDLSVDHFQTISHWAPMAILRIVSQSAQDRTLKGITQQLRISSSEALLHLERLQRLELVRKLAQKSGPEQYERIPQEEVVAEYKSDNSAAKKYYRSILEQLERSLADDPPESRAIGAHVICLDATQLAEARQLTRACHEQLLALSAKSKNKQKIFQSFSAVFELKGTQK